MLLIPRAIPDVLPEDLGQPYLQPPAGTVESPFDRRQGQVRETGDLPEGATLEVVEHDQPTVFGRQVVERLPENGGAGDCPHRANPHQSDKTQPDP